MTGKQKAEHADVYPALAKIKEDLSIPGLSELGVKKSDYDLIIEKAKRSSSMKGNPVQLTDEQMVEILDLAF